MFKSKLLKELKHIHQFKKKKAESLNISVLTKGTFGTRISKFL